jgi:hypothetical protein
MAGISGIVPGTSSTINSSVPGAAGSTGYAAGTGTGQSGVLPLGNGGNGMGGAVSEVWNWINTPFTTPLDPVDIAILVGVIMVSVIAWNLVLWHIRMAAETI